MGKWMEWFWLVEGSTCIVIIYPDITGFVNWHEPAAFGRLTAGDDVVATLFISLLIFNF